MHKSAKTSCLVIILDDIKFDITRVTLVSSVKLVIKHKKTSVYSCKNQPLKKKNRRHKVFAIITFITETFKKVGNSFWAYNFGKKKEEEK